MSQKIFRDTTNSLLNSSNDWFFSSSWVLNDLKTRPTTTYEKTMATMFHYSGEWIASFFGWDKAHSNVVWQVDGLKKLITNGYEENYTLSSEQIQTITSKFGEHRVHPFSLDRIQTSLTKIKLNGTLLNAEQNSQVRWAIYYTQSIMSSENVNAIQRKTIVKVIVNLCRLNEFLKKKKSTRYRGPSI